MPKTAHMYVDYDEDTKKYHQVRVRTEISERMWRSGNPISDWYEAMQYLFRRGGIVMYSSSLQHFLWDVPGYRTVERPDGEYIVWDEKDGEPSPRDADWTNGIVHGWNTDKIGSDGWAHSWIKGTRHVWRCADHVRGMYWQTADLIDGRFQNHHPVENQMQAFSRN